MERGTTRRIGRWAGRGVAALVFAAAVAPVPAVAQDATWPELATSAPEKKSLVVRSQYHYREMVYDPRVVVEKVAAPLANDGHPETLLTSHVSAMKNLDHDWWLSTWDDESRAKILARDAAAGLTAETRLQDWQAGIQGWGVTLERWIETGQYIIVTFKLWPAGEAATSGDASTKEVPLAMKLDGGRWVATLDLEDDPVFQFFDAGTSTIERVVR